MTPIVRNKVRPPPGTNVLTRVPTLQKVASPAAVCPVLIERDRELALLQRIAGEVSAQPRPGAQLVLVTGENGAGKSRLISELVASLPDSWTRMITSGSSSRRPFVEIIAAAEVGPDAPDVEIGRAIAAALATTQGHPTVVVVDDAHRLDTVTLRALGVALDLLDGEPVLVLVGYPLGASTSPSPALTELRRHPRVVQIGLQPLTQNGIATMAAALERDLDAVDVATVMRRSGGNPFFAEELLRSPDTDLSWTLTEAVSERVRTAGEEARRTANLLSVARMPLGEQVLSDLEPGSGVQDLLRAGIIVDAGHGEVAFRHALIGETLARQLAAPERRALHARLAARLEDDPSRPASDIAHHWLDADERSRAAAWAVIAADEAAAQRRYSTANDLYDLALLDPPADDLARAELLERAALAAMWAGQKAACVMRATEADRLYHAAGVSWRASAMWLNPTLRSLPKPEIDTSGLASDSIAGMLAASEAACRTGSYREAAELARGALGRAIALGDLMWELEAASRLIRAGELLEGEAFLHRRLLTARVSNDRFTARRCEALLIEVTIATGDVAASVDHHLGVIELLAPDEVIPWTYEVTLALLHVTRGELDLAREHIDHVLTTDDPVGRGFANLPASWLDLEEDRLDAARVRIAEMAAQVRAFAESTYTRTVLLIEARFRHRLGENEAVMALLDEADAMTGDLFDAPGPELLLVRARVAADLGRADVVSDVGARLQTLIDHGGRLMVPAALDWATGLWERVAGQTDEACRRIEAAAIGMEAATRWVLAAEAWIDLARRDRGEVAARARERAAEICDERGLTWVRRRLDAVATTSSAPPVPTAFARLTPRQRDIATLVAEGRSNQEIADQLFLSVHTVRNQLVAIFDVLGVSRRAEIAAMAARG